MGGAGTVIDAGGAQIGDGVAHALAFEQVHALPSREAVQVGWRSGPRPCDETPVRLTGTSPSTKSLEMLEEMAAGEPGCARDEGLACHQRQLRRPYCVW
jgi:hypothetical protein